MKKLIIIFLVLTSMTSAFSYDGGFLTRNCVDAYVTSDQLATTIEALNEIGIRNTVVKSEHPWKGDFRVLGMARNGMLKVDIVNREAYFKLSSKIRKVLRLNLDNGVEFNIAAQSACIGSF